MAREEYQRALEDLRADVVGMGELVRDRFDESLLALETGDADLARSVVDGDDEINDRYLDIEGDCVDLLALEQPVAGDLRVVAASFKITTDLERIGDLATNLGEYALAGGRAAAESGSPEPVAGPDVREIGEAASDMLANALAAYEAGDAAACLDVAARDDDLDALCQHASEALLRDLIERGAGAGAWSAERVLDDVSRLLLTVRDLERVGDHAVNVAARTRYMVESDPGLIY